MTPPASPCSTTARSRASTRSATSPTCARRSTERSANGAGRPAAGEHRHRPHPLGNPRPRHRGERPPARRQLRQGPHRPQRDRREPHGAAPAAASPRPQLHLRDRRRGRRPPDRPPLRGRPRRGRSRRLRRAARPLRVRRDARRASPDRLIGARKECPLVAGIGEGETFLASAIPAFLADTRTAMPIENGEIVETEAGRRAGHRRRRARPARARARRGHLGRRRGREGRL